MKTINDIAFAHLHVHSEYSLLDGLMSLDEMIDKARDLNLEGIALTDHGKMYGQYLFHKLASQTTDKKGNPLKPVRPILGVEAYVTPNEEFLYRKGKGKKSFHMVLLAKNYEGYQELTKSTRSSEKRQSRGKPVLTDEDLRTYFSSGNIVALSACLGGEIQQYLIHDEYEKAKEKVLFYKELFQDNFYMELQHHGIALQKKIIPLQVQLAKECGIECVITSDAHFLNKEDKKSHDILICMQFNKKIDEYTNDAYTPYHHLMSKEDLFRSFKGIIPDEDILNALDTTGKIAHQCEVSFPKENYYPKYKKIAEGKTADDMLRESSFEGLKTIPGYNTFSNEVKEEYKLRLHTELDVIKTTGYSDYFLIVSDVLNHYENEVKGYVGLGRGSVVGSLVSYATGITKVDPVEHGLYFDRFLNLERVSPPDADIDFDNKREEVFKYTVDTYGENQVCRVITFGTMAAKNAIRSVARVFDTNLSYVNRICKNVTARPGVKLKDCLSVLSDDHSVGLKDMYDNEPEARKLIDTAMVFEGKVNHTGIHAAACIVSDHDLSEFVPLQWDKQSNMWVTQFYKDFNEELGLLKLDYLGLNNLTGIRETTRLINEKYGKTLTHSDIINLAQQDKDVVREIYAQGKTKLVFQFESGGMRDTLTSFNPQTLDDLILLNAVYRPGPMQYIPKIIKNKNNPSATHYDHDVLKPILESTYGYPVYQEQIMSIFRTICGYSLGKADIIRRAMGKKKMSELEAARKDFIAGYQKLGLKEKRAIEFFDEIMEFAKYSFNKSHAAAYTITSLETAYLKLRYPQEYMTASLSYPPKSESYPEFLDECKKMGLEVYLPDINKSKENFTPEGDGIRYGLSAIKGVGKGSKSIVENQPYTSFAQFVDAIPSIDGLNKSKLEALCFGGAFDDMNINRASAYDTLLNFTEAKKKSKKVVEGQIDLFSLGELDSSELIKISDLEEVSYYDKLEKESDVLFAYVSGHPLDEYRPYEEKSELAFKDISIHHDGGEYDVVARIKSLHILYRKKDGKAMAKLILEDFTESLETMVFTNEYEEYAGSLQEGAVMMFRVKVDVQEEEREESSIVVKQLFLRGLSPLPPLNKALIYVDSIDMIDEDLLRRNQGGTQLIFHIEKEKTFVRSKLCVNITDEIKNHFGPMKIATI